MYFATINKSMKLCYVLGIHPDTGYNKRDVFLYTINLIFVILMINLLFLQFIYDRQPLNVMTLADAISCFFILFHGMVKGTSMLLKKRQLSDLLETIRKDFWTFENSENKECLNLLRYSENAFIVYFATYAITLTSFILYPTLSHGEVLVYECYRPSWFPYYALLFYEQYLGIICTLFTTIPVDMIFLSLIVLCRIQFNLLNNELRNLFLLGINKDKEIVKAKFVKCVEHHIFLNNYINRINETFSSTLFAFVGIILMSMCMEMYRASTQSNWIIVLRSFLYTFLGILEFLACYCFPCQALLDEAAKVTESIYNSNWIESTELSKLLLMVIAMGQREKYITACGIVSINLRTGLDTVKSMISYCMFLKTITNSTE